MPCVLASRRYLFKRFFLFDLFIWHSAAEDEGDKTACVNKGMFTQTKAKTQTATQNQMLYRITVKPWGNDIFVSA